jgi:hypothetical protein
MQVAFVLILAAAGLGCHNKPGDALEGNGVSSYQVDSGSVPSHQTGGTSTSTPTFVSSPYPEIPTRLYTSYSPPHSVDWRAEVHSTLYSFVFGHDPNISTVRDIEASVYGVDTGP